MRRWTGVLLVLAGLLLPSLAAAHLVPNSEIGLSISRGTIRADIVIPLGELRYAEPGLAAASPERLGAWLLGHIGAQAPDGRPWAAKIVRARIGGAPTPDLEAEIALIPPAGAPVRRLSLRYDAVLDRLPSHFALVYLKDDYDAGRLGNRPALLGGLRQGSVTVAIDRGEAQGWQGFWAAIGLGMKHIAEGHDHLLFLIGLLLPAPLLVSAPSPAFAGEGRGEGLLLSGQSNHAPSQSKEEGRPSPNPFPQRRERAFTRRWRGYAGGRRTIRSLALIVTAFTIGHSLTLIGGALFDWQLPARPVEAMIALSILITAIHAWRPIFAGREAFVAAGFGLVHGLAFATIIGHFALDPWPKGQAILGFNLGIEIVQLLVVGLVAPPLALLARGGHYHAVRVGGALFIGLAAALWLGERLSGREIAAARFVDAALGHAAWALVPIFAISLFSAWRTSGSRRPPDRR